MQSQELTQPTNDFGETPTKTADIAIPSDASGKLEYWFKMTCADGKTYHDSNFSQNYHANIVAEDSIPTPLSFRGTPV